MSHFEALGFEVGSIDDLDRLVRKAIADTEPVVRADGGLTYVRGTDSGAALCVHLDSAGGVAAVEPFLAAEYSLLAQYERVITHPDCRQQSLVLASLPSFYIAFVTPHVEAWSATLRSGVDELEIAVAGIADAVTILDDSTEWVGELALTGLDAIPPEPSARLVGRVDEHMLRHNEIGTAFEWACLDINGTPLEICAAVHDLEMPFQTGMLVGANVRLVGPILASGS